MGKVIYLTGAPASGKSSTTQLLKEKISNLLVWEYGARLTEHIKKSRNEITQQSELRRDSSKIITVEDIAEVDRSLISFTSENRATCNVIIDSHAVTKEIYGFRVTPFSFKQFNDVAPDEIWVLYASPELTIERIAKAPAGRPQISEEEARMHTLAQTALAISYGAAIGRPVYLFDTNGDREMLLSRLEARLK